ncbi:MAG: hypothetical protein RL264_1775 [Bacteroidota bacterium]|jgi:cell division protein FtsW
MKGIFSAFQGDRTIWLVIFILTGFSAVFVYSFVTILSKMEGEPEYYYLFKHLLFVAMGFGAAYFVHRLDTRLILKLSKAMLILSAIALFVTMFFGVEVNGAGRWIRVPGLGLTFQTSDFAKLSLIIYLAVVLVKFKEQFNDWKILFWQIVVPILVICGLIFKDNFSTSFLLLLISFTMLFIGGVPFQKLIVIVLSMLFAGVLVIMIQLSFPSVKILPRLTTWVNRIDNRYVDESDNIANAQANNAQLAIHNGGIFGKGFGRGKLKEYIPEAYADFFYSSLVEEKGFLGAAILVIAYLILLMRIIAIGLQSSNPMLTYLAFGIAIHFMAQASINMLVCTGIFPVTGQNMPFLAMGGSAMLTALISIAIVQAIARENTQTKTAPTEEAE